jgi:tetratricopeptide (TPR) repeat protein
MVASVFNVLKRCGGGFWLLLLALFALSLPQDGDWTIDDGIKLVGAHYANPPWHVDLPDGPLRSSLRDPAAYPPFYGPFAERENGAIRLGFSPWTMALWGIAAQGGAVALALLPVLGAFAIWLLMRRWKSSLEEIVFLLPLTFYSLMMWEHTIALAFEAAGLLLLFRARPAATLHIFLAGALFAAGALLRPEMALVIAVIFGFLWWRDRFAGALVFLFVSVILMAIGLWVSRSGGNPLVPSQVLLNFKFSGIVAPSFAQALAQRVDAFWALLFMMDPNLWLSLGLLLLLCFASFLVFRAERRRILWLGLLGAVLLFLWFVIVQFRLWTHPLPPIALLHRNGLLYAFPWILLLFFYRERENRPFLWTASVLALLVIVTAPVFRGVHWGPRFLLPALLLLIPVYANAKNQMTKRGWLWRSLLALTVLQSLSSAVVVYGRREESAGLVRFLEGRVHTPLVVPSQMQAADLGPLWSKVEMFAAPSPSVERRFIADARRAGAQSFWLLLMPKFGEENAMEDLPGVPMHLQEQDSFTTGILWKTPWWLGKFGDTGDSAAWGAFYDDLARREIARGELERALPEHESAVEFAPRSADYHYNYALTLGRLGFLTQAREELQKAVAADSLHKSARELLQKITAASSSSP